MLRRGPAAEIARALAEELGRPPKGGRPDCVEAIPGITVAGRSDVEPERADAGD